MKSRLAFLFIVLIPTLAFANKEAVVKIGKGCTGVNVHPSGFVLSAWHCPQKEFQFVEFQDGRIVKFKRLVAGEGRDTVVGWVAVEPGTFPYAEIGLNAPKKGDKVHSWGYPVSYDYFGGAFRNLRFSKGFVSRFTKAELFESGRIGLLGKSNSNCRSWNIKIRPKGFQPPLPEPNPIPKDKKLGEYDCTITSCKTGPGWSGGPLFNDKDRVIGILSGGDRRESLWMVWSVVKDVYDKANIKKANKPKLYAFVMHGCGACELFKRDYRNGYFHKYDVKLIYWGTSEWKKEVERLKKKGIKIPQTVPFFHVEGAKKVVQVDPYNRKSLLEVIGNLIKGIVGIIIPLPEDNPSATPLPDQPAAPSNPSPVNPAKPVEEDWSGVQIVLLISQFTEGLDPAKKAGLAIAEGPLKRAVSRISKGKASLRIVSQRLTPKRYEAVKNAGGLGDHKFSVLILVPKTNQSLTRSIVLKKVQGEVNEKLVSELVDVVFERTSSNDFNKIIDAFSVVDEKVEPKEEVKTVIKEVVADKSVDAIKLLAEKQAEGNKWLQYLLWAAGGIGTFLGGKSLTEVIKSRIHKKIEDE